MPGIHLRTTLMVGHPGETEADFEELKEFVRKVRFDRMGHLHIPRRKVRMPLPITKTASTQRVSKPGWMIDVHPARYFCRTERQQR